MGLGIVYKSVDGKEFNSERERQDYYYENHLKAFLLFFGKDLNIGDSNNYENKILLLVRCKEQKHELFVEHYAFEFFGNRIKFVQGVYNEKCVREYWTYEESEIHRLYLGEEPPIRKIEVGVTPWWKDSFRKLEHFRK